MQTCRSLPFGFSLFQLITQVTSVCVQDEKQMAVLCGALCRYCLDEAAAALRRSITTPNTSAARRASGEHSYHRTSEFLRRRPVSEQDSVRGPSGVPVTVMRR